VDKQHLELWDRISSFWIDGAQAALSFAKRLARENGWSLAYADRVIDEYKRFVFLCMTAGHKCTPSDQVDQAWHLHMVYTESYWTRMCGEVLGRPLHHGPTKGGDQENDKFVDWYERTKESYRAAFGTEPPADIWPPSSERFANAGAWQRVDTSRFLIVYRRRAKSNVLLAAGGACALFLAGCGILTSDDPTGRVLLMLGIGFSAIALIIYGAVAGWFRGRGGGGCGGGACGGGAGCGGDSSGCGGGGCGGGGCGGGCSS
jgi:hypothetical protein